MNIDELIIITDFGKGFDSIIIENRDISKKLPRDYKCSWGIMLLKGLSDELKIDSSNNGTKITITKNLR